MTVVLTCLKCYGRKFVKTIPSTCPALPPCTSLSPKNLKQNSCCSDGARRPGAGLPVPRRKRILRGPHVAAPVLYVDTPPPCWEKFCHAACKCYCHMFDSTRTPGPAVPPASEWSTLSLGSGFFPDLLDPAQTAQSSLGGEEIGWEPHPRVVCGRVLQWYRLPSEARHGGGDTGTGPRPPAGAWASTKASNARRSLSTGKAWPPAGVAMVAKTASAAKSTTGTQPVGGRRRRRPGRCRPQAEVPGRPGPGEGDVVKLHMECVVTMTTRTLSTKEHLLADFHESYDETPAGAGPFKRLPKALLLARWT